MQQSVKIGAARLHDVTERMVVERRGSWQESPGYRPRVSLLSLSEATRSHSSDEAAVSVPDSSWGAELVIRSLDIVGALLMLALALPVMLLVSLLVKLTSHGPVLYKQERVGKGGRIFTLYKFRTMIDGAERHVGPVWAARDDERVTSVGRVLRRTRLDELPQVYNILRGDMSLVGPRPERPFFVARHTALQGARLSVKPGLTGLAQVRSFYDLKPSHKVRYDRLYIRNRSLLLNLYILLQTVPTIFARKGW
jgi:lipopolysaccharide/colanic/teichoic acid biosynthesis glycosyltransferase